MKCLSAFYDRNAGTIIHHGLIAAGAIVLVIAVMNGIGHHVH